MFDVGFFELIVIAIIGLFVIGPERLPGAIRTVAMWVGRVRYFITETRSEFEKQIGADDIRRELHNEQVMRSLEALKQSKDDLENSIENTIKETQNSILPNREKEEDLPDSYPHDENGHAVLDNSEDKPNNAKENNATQPASDSDEQNENSQQIEENDLEKKDPIAETQPSTAPTDTENIQAAPTK